MICKKQKNKRNFLVGICSFLFLLKRKKKFCVGFVVFLIFFRFFWLHIRKIRRDLKFRSKILVSIDIHRLPKFWTWISNPALFFQIWAKKNDFFLIMSGDLTMPNPHSLSKIFRFFLLKFGKIRRDLQIGSKILVIYVYQCLPKFRTWISNPALFFQNRPKKNGKKSKKLQNPHKISFFFSIGIKNYKSQPKNFFFLFCKS